MAAPKTGEGSQALERIGGALALAEAYNNRERFPSEDALARHFGVSKSGYFKMLRLAKQKHPDLFIDRAAIHDELLRKGPETAARVANAAFSLPPNPDTDAIDVAMLVAQKKRHFDRITRREEALRSVPIKVTIDGPIGILHHGDPHIDDDGADIHALEHHANLCRETEGLFAGNVGDGLNNWVGRLARLYGSQSTTEMQAVALLEWWMGLYQTPEGRTKWLYLISGNHDYWHGDARDPMRWIATQAGALHQPSEIRMRLELPSGRSCSINARHDFSGHSMWNPAHGVGRAVQMGNWDDISVCGHRHVSGYMILRCPQDDRICHALQVASYKLYDRFARDKGFRDQHVSPAVLTIIDPYAKTAAGFVSVFHDVDTGVDFLKWRRAQWARRG